MSHKFDVMAACYQPVKAHRLTEKEVKSGGQRHLPGIPSYRLNGAPAYLWCERTGKKHEGFSPRIASSQR
jgi:hypothetical protein